MLINRSEVEFHEPTLYSDITVYESTLLRRSFHYTATRKFAMTEGGVTAQELEEALKSRLSATHTEINDISGAKPYCLG